MGIRTANLVSLIVCVVVVDLGLEQLQHQSMPRLSDVPGLLEQLGCLFAFRGGRQEVQCPRVAFLLRSSGRALLFLCTLVVIATSTVNSTTHSAFAVAS